MARSLTQGWTRSDVNRGPDSPLARVGPQQRLNYWVVPVRNEPREVIESTGEDSCSVFTSVDISNVLDSIPNVENTLVDDELENENRWPYEA
jgi:hypothetical protein